jgi:hypothetical protein
LVGHPAAPDASFNDTKIHPKGAGTHAYPALGQPPSFAATSETAASETVSETASETASETLSEPASETLAEPSAEAVSESVASCGCAPPSLESPSLASPSRSPRSSSPSTALHPTKESTAMTQSRVRALI